MIQVIPAIDIIGGKCVRLSQGDYASAKTYYDQPLDVAHLFEDHGIKRLHMVDLDGAREKRVVNYKVLEQVASKTKLHIDFGGGIQSDTDLKIAFENGAQQITGGSIAVKNRELFSQWLQQYGADKIILGADTKEKKIAISGWQEKTEVHLLEICEYYLEKGIKYCISTDVAKDGMLQGPSFDLYKELQDRFPKLQVIASGGVSSVADIEQLHEMQMYGVIVGKAIYEGTIKLTDLKPFLG